LKYCASGTSIIYELFEGPVYFYEPPLPGQVFAALVATQEKPTLNLRN
jgi:hypothetical protein